MQSSIIDHRKKLKYSRLSSQFITYSIRIRTLDWCKCQKQPLEGFCGNDFLKNFAKLTEKHLCQATFFTDNLRTTAFKMRTLQKRSERNRLSLLQRGGCNAYCFGYNPRARGKHITMRLLWAFARLLVTRLSLIYQVHEFFSRFLVQLKEARRLGESKVLSFCFCC